MDEAKRQHADTLAPSDFEQAQKSWDRAQAADKEGNTGTAKVLFESARIHFGKAAEIAKARRDALSRQLSAMQLIISSNFDQVNRDLARGNLPLAQSAQVRAIASEVEEDKVSILKLVARDDYQGAVATAKAVQTKIYNAQLILAGQKGK